MAGKVARMGVLTALAIVFGYIEVLIPFNIGIPGVKLGIANIVVVIGLYKFSYVETLTVSVLRIMLMGFMFGNAAMIMYSLAGGILSFAVMIVAKKIPGLSTVGVSIAGGVSHNIGQLIVASVVLETSKLIVYVPVLLVAGLITGAANGIISLRVLKSIK